MHLGQRVGETLKDVLVVPVLLSNFSVKTFPDTVVTRVTVGRRPPLAATKALEKSCESRMDMRVSGIETISLTNQTMRVCVCVCVCFNIFNIFRISNIFNI